MLAAVCAVLSGVTLRAEVVLPVAIIGHPQSQTVQANEPVTFSVTVSGTKPQYRWQFNGANLSGATNASYTLANVTPANAGAYRVVVTNSVNTVTSQVATLTVLLDTTPPRLISAVANEATTPPFYITVRFDERVASASAGAKTNYIVTELGSTNELVVSIVPVNANLVRLTVSPWRTNTDYILTVNNVTDTAGNPIAPNSRVGVAFWRSILPMNARWNWNEDFDLTGQDWTSPGYDESTNEWFSGGQWVIPDPIWDPVGRAPFYFPVVADYSIWPLPNTVLTFGRSCYYFRTRFVLPPNSSAVGEVRLAHLTDDGAAFYLNGTEVLRYHLPYGPITDQTLATLPRGRNVGTLTTAMTVTNLLAGTNVLAVELHPFSLGPHLEEGIAFGLSADAAIAPLVPPEFSPALPALDINRVSGELVVVSWTAPACGLQTKFRVEDEWSDLPGVTSPFTNAVTATRFFRLRCP